MPKLQHNKGLFFISLPKSLVIKKGWKKSQDLFLACNDRGNLEVFDNF